MVKEKYPLEQFRHLVERIEQVSLLHRNRHWIGNDDTERNYLITLPRAEDPMYVDLAWRHDAGSPSQFVGIYAFHLGALYSEGYIRARGPEHLRMRIVHCSDDVLYIQTKSGKPALAIGEVRAAGRH